MTCRCPMCGVKNAGKINRESYAQAGLGCDEYLSSQEKREQRKLRRKIEERKWRKEQE